MTVLGVDVSHWQGDLTAFWPKAKAAGVAFGFAKATDDTGWVDPEFARNLAGMRANGIVPGAYHFLQTGDGAAQADHFVATVKAQNAGKTAGVLCSLDVERRSPGAVTPTDVLQFAVRFKSLTAVQPLILYISRGFWTEYHMGTLAPLGPLWQAIYSGAGWPTPGFGGWATTTLWQFTDALSVAGMSVDGDRFNGTIDQLRALTGTTTGDDMAQADIEAINKHTDAVITQAFMSLSHGLSADGSKSNGTGIDQLAKAITALAQTVGAEGTSPAELKAALAGLIDVDALATAVAGKLGGSADANAVKQAVRDVLIEGTGGTA